MTAPLRSVLETRARKRVPPPTSLKQLEDNLYDYFPIRIAAQLKARGGPTPN
jgi:hypothetical protein